MKTLFELTNISYKFEDKNVLSNINLTIKEGEKIALIGKNGAGKSTLISILNGTYKQTYGVIKIDGNDFNELDNNQKARIGTIWQDLRLIDDLSAEQNVNCGLLGKKNFIFTFKNLLNICSFRKAHECMKLCKLNKNIYSNNINKLSGGQRQRIAISRSLIQEPVILFADEPFNNLDPKISLYLKNLFVFGNFVNKIKIPNTFLFCLHRLDLLDGFTRIIGLKKGQILFDVKKNQLNSSHIKNLY